MTVAKKRMRIGVLDVEGTQKNVRHKDLRHTYAVRAHGTDPTRIEYLALQIQSNAALDPLVTTEDNELISGNHTLLAREVLGRHESDAIMISEKDPAKLLAMAMLANQGGPLPLTKDDLEYAVGRMLELGLSVVKIHELIGGFLSLSIVRSLVKSVQINLKHKRLARAVDAVVNGGYTVEKAALEFNVYEADIKESLGQARHVARGGSKELKHKLTTNFKALGLRNAALARNLYQEVEAGDKPPAQARDFLAKWQRLHRKNGSSLEGWITKFEALFAARKAGGAKKQ